MKRFKPSTKMYLMTVRRRYFFCGTLVLFMYCVWQVSASVHCCLVVICRGRVDLLALVCDVYMILLLSHFVSYDMCDTLLYRFLILVVFLNFIVVFVCI